VSIAVAQNEMREIFSQLKIAGSAISNGGQVHDIVVATLGTGSLMKAAQLTSWVLENWTNIWHKLAESLDALVSWVEDAWSKVRGAFSDFWEWLMSLFS
jgi:hypothetical protein